MLCGRPHWGVRRKKMPGFKSFFENDNWCSQCGWVGNMFSTGDYYGELHSRESYSDNGNHIDLSDDDWFFED